MCFLWLDGVMGYRKEDHKGKSPLSHDIKVHAIHMTTELLVTYQHNLALNLDHPAKVVFASFLHCKLIFSSLSIVPLEQSPHEHLTLKQWWIMFYFLQGKFLYALVGIVQQIVFRVKNSLFNNVYNLSVYVFLKGW